MTTYQHFEQTSNPILSCIQWFEKAVPHPTAKNLTVQIGVHFEEVAEFAEALAPHLSPFCQAEAEDLQKALHNFAQKLKTAPVVDYVDDAFAREPKALDAVVDQLVTGLGIAYMAGWKALPAFVEVNRSNWSKFVDGEPVFNPNGKIAKGENYTPPNLSLYL